MIGVVARHERAGAVRAAITLSPAAR